MSALTIYKLPRICDVEEWRPGRRARTPIQQERARLKTERENKRLERLEVTCMAKRDQSEAEMDAPVRAIVQIRRDGQYEMLDGDVLFVHYGGIHGKLHSCVIKSLHEAHLFEFDDMLNPVLYLLIDNTGAAWIETGFRTVQPADETDPYVIAARKMLANRTRRAEKAVAA